jgi:hypothetical protein
MNNPCEGCLIKHKCGDGWADKPDHCEELKVWQGYQEGLAEAESRVKTREREIVEWLREQDLDNLVAKGRLTSELESWLRHLWSYGVTTDREDWP